MERVPNRLGIALLGSVLLFAGCNGGAWSAGSTMPAGTRERVAFVRAGSATVGSALIYSGSTEQNVITYFPESGTNPPPLGQITSGLNEPESLFVDSESNLWVANSGTFSILEYAPGGTSPMLTISNGVNAPNVVAVDSNGTVYSGNYGNHTITEYPAGQTSPSLTIHLKSPAVYLAIGPSNGLYVSQQDGTVTKFKAGAAHGATLNPVVWGPMQVDKDGKILMVDLGNQTFNVFLPGQTTPSKTIRINAQVGAIVLNRAETQVYVSETTGSSWKIQHLPYPDGTSFSNKITSNVKGGLLTVNPNAL